MSWVVAIWSMTVAICLTLAGIHLLIWLRERNRWSSLAFAVTAVSVAGTAVAELLIMRAHTPQDVTFAIMLANVVLLFLLGGLVAFIRTSLGHGRLWLGAGVLLSRAAGLALLLGGPREGQQPLHDALPEIRFLGETVTVVTTDLVNPWWEFNLISSLLFLAYLVDASLRTWRNGTRRDRRLALTIGGSTTLFILVAGTVAGLINRGVIQSPYLISFPFLAVVLIVAYELSREVLRGRRMEIRLENVQESLNFAARSAGFGVFSHDFATGVTSLSDELREIFGLPAGAGLDLGGDFLPVAIHPRDRPAVRAAISSQFEADGPRGFEADFRIHRPDGTERWVRVQGTTAFSPGGRGGRAELLRTTGIVQDITERMTMVSEIRTMRDQLARADRVSSLGQLSSALAHEISQPLGAILRNAEALQLLLDSPAPDMDEVKSIVGDIIEDDRRASDTILRMRSLLKERTISFAPVPLGRLVRDTVSLVRAEARARQIDIRTNIPPDLPPVRGDRIHIQQILLNLLINAMEALAPDAGPGAGDGKGNGGGSEIVIGARAATNGMIELSVADNGPGVPEALRAKVFEPFFTSKPDGLGMGLAVSGTIAAAHGGRITLEAGKNDGALFRLTLPASTTEEDGP